MPFSKLQSISNSSKRKHPAVVEALSELARELGPGAKLPTTRELAKALGVTGATLSRGLEQLESRGVLRCLQGSGVYVESGVLQKRVALVFGGDVFSPGSSEFGALLLKCCAKRASDHNERFSFFLDNLAFHGVMDGSAIPAHQDLSDALKMGKIDGILLVNRTSIEQEVWLRSHGIPVVRLDTSLDSRPLGSDVVIIDYDQMIHRGVTALAAAGCRTLGLLGVLAEHGSMFRATLAEQGLETRDLWVSHPAAVDFRASNSHEQIGREAARQLMADAASHGYGLEHVGLPDGLLITDDIMAVGALKLFDSLGVDIGGRLKVASHANKGSSILAPWESRITHLQSDPYEIAVTLLNTLESLMNGHPSSCQILIPHAPRELSLCNLKNNPPTH
ncbi:hypothetical protein BH09VER1_BH09VER1_53830 [soil metagenome]